jgi:hypothetical protein
MMGDDPLPSRPEGDYAIVEQLGHTTFIGRVVEVERFGSKMLSIEPIFRDVLLDPLLIGGSTIYRFTPCSAEVAFSRQAKEDWQLPAPIRAVLPPTMLPPPALDIDDDEEDPVFAPSFLDDVEPRA